MNVGAPLDPARHPYPDRQPTRLLIDVRWVEAASGQTFDTLNPSTGQALAAVAEGDAEDINRAVAAPKASATRTISRAASGPARSGSTAARPWTRRCRPTATR